MVRTIRTIGLSIFLLGIFAFVVTRWSNRAASSDFRDRLVLGTAHDFIVVNPLGSSVGDQDSFLDLLFSTLVKFDSVGRVQPSLAESWTHSVDFKHWNFKLRSNTLFHDGVQLTANDVVFTFKALSLLDEKEEYSGLLKNVDSVSVQDDLTVVFNLKKPDQSFLFLVNMVFIAPSHCFNEDGTPRDPNYGYYPIGSGPFKVKSFGSEQIELEANTNYFLGVPQVPGIVYKRYPSERALLMALVRREVDVLSTPTSSYVYSKVTGNIPYINSDHHLTAGLFLFFNLSSEILQDSKVRLALNYLVDRDKLISNRGLNQAKPSSSIVPLDGFGFDASVQPYRYDPAYALQLLKEAGWASDQKTGKLMKNGKAFFIEIVAMRDVRLIEDILQTLMVDFEGFGIKLNVRLMQPQEIASAFSERSSPASYFYYYVNPAGIYGDWAMWNNDYLGYLGHAQNVAEALDQARFTEDEQSSLRAYQEFQHLIRNDPPALFLFWQDFPIFYNTRVKNLEPDQMLTYRELYRASIATSEESE